MGSAAGAAHAFLFKHLVSTLGDSHQMLSCKKKKTTQKRRKTELYFGIYLLRYLDSIGYIRAGLMKKDTGRSFYSPSVTFE